MSQFAILNELLTEWRRDGHGWEVLELWAVGDPDSEAQVGDFAKGSEASCFVDTSEPQSSAFKAWV